MTTSNPSPGQAESVSNNNPTQIAVFSYLFWRIDPEVQDAAAKMVQREVQLAIEQLYRWLGQASPFVVRPFVPSSASLFSDAVWYRSGDSLVKSNIDTRLGGYADCRSAGGTVTLAVATVLDSPTQIETVDHLLGGHLNPTCIQFPMIGADMLWGVNFEREISESCALVKDNLRRVFGSISMSAWCQTADRDERANIFLAGGATPTTNREILLVMSGLGAESQRATTLIAANYAPAAARYRSRVRDIYDNLYSGSLETRLRVNAELLAIFQKPVKEMNALEDQISDLAERIADYGQAQSELQAHLQSLRIDRDNLMILMESNAFPRLGWFGQIHFNVQNAARQIESEAAYASIQFQRACTLMTSLRAQSDILRARVEQQENSRVMWLGLQLTAMGLVIGLGQIIDRDTGREFVGWLNGWGVATYDLSDHGLTLFLARVALVAISSVSAFVFGFLMFKVFRALQRFSSAGNDH